MKISWAGIRGDLLPAAAGALAGVRSQLYFLTYVEWDHPWARLPAGAALGFAASLALLGFLRWILRNRLNGGERSLVALRAGFALQMLVTAWFWVEAGRTAWGWAAPAGSLLLISALGVWWVRRGPDRALLRPPVLAACLAGACMVLAFALRHIGVDHGLPDYIPHCDTPRMLAWLSNVLKGQLVAPTSYPMGHIYLYAYLMKAAAYILPTDFWNLSPFSAEPAGYLFYVTAARAQQVLLGTGLCGLVFLIGRRLWGDWAGLAAAFLVAVDPLQMTYSRQVMGDVPQVFWMFFSLYFSVRVLQGGGRWDYFWAGMGAGMAAATKLYGGYIILAVLAAHYLGGNRGKGIWRNLAALAGAVLGMAALTPTLWLEPVHWFNNLLAETGGQYEYGAAMANRGLFLLDFNFTGIPYLWNSMLHRFHPPWMLAALAGLAFLAVRRRKEDLLVLLPALFLLMIFSLLKLARLREWDLASLTPFLALAMGAGLPPLWAAVSRRGWMKAAAGAALAAFLSFQTLVAAGDAWIAAYPDTRHFAESWLKRHTDSGEGVLFHAMASHAFANWLPQDSRMAPVGTDWPEKEPPCFTGNKLFIMEFFWWDDSPGRDNLEPAHIVRVRNYYWENPIIYFYDLKMRKFRSEVIIPHNRVLRPGPVDLDTAWSGTRPIDVMSGEPPPEPDGRAYRPRLVLPAHGTEEMGFVCLGQGRGLLGLGPGLERRLEAGPDHMPNGFITPLRSLIPLFPPNYRLELKPEPLTPALWVGVYPSPEGMLPLLARQGLWPEVLEAARRARQRPGPGAAEVRLFEAAALSAAGDRAGAAGALAEVKRRYPGFLEAYAGLGDIQEEDFWAALGKLTTASRSLLLGERARWSADPGANASAPGGDWPGAEYRYSVREAHLWMPWEFLPGFVKVRAQWECLTPEAGRTGRMKVFAHTKDYFCGELGEKEVGSGSGRDEMRVEVPRGPLKLDVGITHPEEQRPRLMSVEVIPDLQAEYAWRWRLLAGKLGEAGLPVGAGPERADDGAAAAERELLPAR